MWRTRRRWRGTRAWWPASAPGPIELLGSTVSERVRSSTPRAALLSTLAGIALTFIAIGFLFRAYARPIIGLGTLAIILLVYFGRVRFREGCPAASWRSRSGRRSRGSPDSLLPARHRQALPFILRCRCWVH